MKKGTTATVVGSKDESFYKFWELKSGDKHTVVKLFWYNGEHHVKTDKGEYPAIFFEEYGQS